ncbi:hypothetical protein LCGC14_2852520, partial [marine sediment metagenome]
MEFISIRRKINRHTFISEEKIFVNPKRLSLDLGGLRLKSISNAIGLEKLVNLRRLELQGNGLTKIEGLEDLNNLQELFLSSNNISKIENLGSLTNLKTLFLDDTKVTRIQG